MISCREILAMSRAWTPLSQTLRTVIVILAALRGGVVSMTRILGIEVILSEHLRIVM